MISNGSSHAHDTATALLREHLLDDALRDMDEAVQIRGRERAKVFRRVVREGLREEDSRVVHEHIDGAEAPHRGIDEVLGGSRQSDIAIDEREVDRTLQRVLLTDVARVGHYVVPALEEQVRQCGTDSLRRARHDGGLAFRSHVKLLIENCVWGVLSGSTCGLIHQASQRLARARIDSVLERRPVIGSELVFVRCSLPFRVTAPRYCSPSTPVDKAGPQIAVSSISRARVAYGIAPMLDNAPCDAKLACMKSETAAGPGLVSRR